MALHTGAKATVGEWLRKGRRSDCVMAENKWGLLVREYQSAISGLRRGGMTIDSDQKWVIRGGERRLIASHTRLKG